MKKAIGYVRVSSEEQVTNYSLDNQTDYLVKEAVRSECELIKVFREEGKSAKNLKRPKLIELLEYCQKNQKNIDILLVYKTDRLSRDTFDYLVIKRKLASYGITIISATEPSSEDPMGNFMSTLMAATAQLDNQIRSQRTLDGMKKRIESGWLAGKAPLGYLNKTENDRLIIVKHPEYFELMKQSWEEMAMGTQTLKSMVPFMQSLGLPIKHRSQAQRIFRNPFYIGKVKSKNFNLEVEGKHDRMIEDTIFYHVQELLNGRSYTAGISHKAANPDFSLRNLVFCKQCGSAMSGSWSKGKSGKKYAYYFCNAGKHSSKSIPKEKFENEFIEYLKSIKPKQDLMNLFNELVKERWAERYSTINQRAKETEKELKRLVEMRKAVTSHHLSGLYSDEIFKEQLDKIDNEMLAKNVIQSETKLDNIDIDIVIDFQTNFIANIDKAWANGDISQRQLLVSSIFPEKIYYENSIYGTQELGYCFKLIREIEYPNNISGVIDGI